MICRKCGKENPEPGKFCNHCGTSLEITAGVQKGGSSRRLKIIGTEEEIYKEASKRVKEKKRFYRGLVTYAVVNAVLVAIWVLSGRGYPWFLWPLGIWGVFVLGDFLRIFILGKESDDEAIKKEVEKMKREQSRPEAGITPEPAISAFETSTPSQAVKPVCSKCGSANQPNANFCDHCGASLDASKTCAKCGFLNQPEVAFCGRCSQSLKDVPGDQWRSLP